MNPRNIVIGADAIIKAYKFPATFDNQRSIQAQIVRNLPSYWNQMTDAQRHEYHSRMTPKPEETPVKVQFGTGLAKIIMEIIVQGLPASDEQKKALREANIRV